MDRRTLLWTITAFFGATVAFQVTRNLTEDQSGGVQLVTQMVVLALIIALIVLVIRRTERGDDS